MENLLYWKGCPQTFVYIVYITIDEAYENKSPFAIAHSLPPGIYQVMKRSEAMKDVLADMPIKQREDKLRIVGMSRTSSPMCQILQGLCLLIAQISQRHGSQVTPWHGGKRLHVRDYDWKNPKQDSCVRRWSITNLCLCVRILRPPWQVNLEKLREVFKEALRVWSDVTPLTFTEVTSGRADINIDFTRYQHGDNLPFDGPGGILAHAFFPKTYREGDIHFDYDEFWTLGNSMGTDLLQVAAHEFGHVLGLHHSLAPGAIMSPFYSFSYPLELSEDDKRGIQYLYGTKPVKEREQEQQTRQPETTETNEIERTTPNECYTDFSAVSMIRGELFFFKSGYVWRIRNGRLQPGYPAQASRHWGGIPDNIDAAFEDKSGNIWFFQGQNYWVFDAERQITGPDSVQKLGLSVTDIQAALTWGEDKAQKIYFFKGGKYWRFNPEENRVEWSHARSMADWRGIPKDIDAAFLDRYGYAHFLRGRQYWKFDPVEVKALEGYPRYIGMDFFGCPASMYQ